MNKTAYCPAFNPLMLNYERRLVIFIAMNILVAMAFCKFCNPSQARHYMKLVCVQHHHLLCVSPMFYSSDWFDSFPARHGGTRLTYGICSIQHPSSAVNQLLVIIIYNIDILCEKMMKINSVFMEMFCNACSDQPIHHPIMAIKLPQIIVRLLQTSHATCQVLRCHVFAIQYVFVPRLLCQSAIHRTQNTDLTTTLYDGM